MRLPATAAHSHARFSKIALSVASTSEEIREVQRLRCKALAHAMGMAIPCAQHSPDEDALDPYCDHLIARDRRSLKVVGTATACSVRARQRVAAACMPNNGSTSTACSTCAAA
jgi:putative hemolysin